MLCFDLSFAVWTSFLVPDGDRSSYIAVKCLNVHVLLETSGKYERQIKANLKLRSTQYQVNVHG